MSSGTKKWLVSLSVLVATAAIGAFALRSSPAGPGKEKGFDVLKLSVTLADGALIAEEKGFFARHHIRIDWTGKQAHGPAAIVALVAGQNDAAVSISTSIIIARTHGAKLKLIASQNTSSKELPLFRYLVRDGSPITGAAGDFVGKRVVASPTTITWYPLVVYLKRAGIDYSKTEFVQLPSPMATEQALREGKVDVIGGTEIAPPASKMLAEGGVHFIAGLSDFDVLGIHQIGGWAMREDFIEKHPDVVRRFIAALRDAYEWGNAHPAEAQAILNRRNEVPKEYEQYQKKWRPAPLGARVEPESIRKWLAVLEEFGQVPPGSVKPEDVFTNAYNPPEVAAGASR